MLIFDAFSSRGTMESQRMFRTNRDKMLVGCLVAPILIAASSNAVAVPEGTTLRDMKPATEQSSIYQQVAVYQPPRHHKVLIRRRPVVDENNEHSDKGNTGGQGSARDAGTTTGSAGSDHGSAGSAGGGGAGAGSGGGSGGAGGKGK
jgi:hypothetical protein